MGGKNRNLIFLGRLHKFFRRHRLVAEDDHRRIVLHEFIDAGGPLLRGHLLHIGTLRLADDLDAVYIVVAIEPSQLQPRPVDRLGADLQLLGGTGE